MLQYQVVAANSADFRATKCGSFGAAYGRNRIMANTVSSMIWGNAPFCKNAAGAAVSRDQLLHG
jgi:hypothetical protein